MPCVVGKSAAVMAMRRIFCPAAVAGSAGAATAPTPAISRSRREIMCTPSGHADLGEVLVPGLRRMEAGHMLRQRARVEVVHDEQPRRLVHRSEEHTSELQS